MNNMKEQDYYLKNCIVYNVKQNSKNITQSISKMDIILARKNMVLAKQQ